LLSIYTRTDFHKGILELKKHIDNEHLKKGLAPATTAEAPSKQDNFPPKTPRKHVSPLGENEVLNEGNGRAFEDSKEALEYMKEFLALSQRTFGSQIESLEESTEIHRVEERVLELEDYILGIQYEIGEIRSQLRESKRSIQKLCSPPVPPLEGFLSSTFMKNENEDISRSTTIDSNGSVCRDINIDPPIDKGQVEGPGMDPIEDHDMHPDEGFDEESNEGPLLTTLKMDYMTTVLVMRWIEFLFERISRDKLLIVLDYYIEIGWINRHVKAQIMTLARGEMPDVMAYRPIEEENDGLLFEGKDDLREYKDINDWRLSADDHLRSLLFVMKITGREVSKDALSTLEHEIKEFKGPLNGFHGI